MSFADSFAEVRIRVREPDCRFVIVYRGARVWLSLVAERRKEAPRICERCCTQRRNSDPFARNSGNVIAHIHTAPKQDSTMIRISAG